jgi:hypothetical protein
MLAVRQLLLALMLSLAAPCWAAGGLSVDARFDITGDGIIDAEDWAQMTEESKAAYAYASVSGLGEDPYALVEGQFTRGDRYLQGLRSVYE